MYTHTQLENYKYSLLEPEAILIVGRQKRELSNKQQINLEAKEIQERLGITEEEYNSKIMEVIEHERQSYLDNY